MTSDFKKAINTISSLIEANEKVALPIFAAKLAKKTKEYPEDVTLGMMHNVVEKMSGSNKLFISKSEIQDLYSKLYTRNNKFASLFAEELGVSEKDAAPETHKVNSLNQSYESDIFEDARNQIVDPLLANALDEAFGAAPKPFTDKMKKSAESICASLLTFPGVKSEVKASCGNENWIVCTASFETPKGQTNIIVPVEIEGQSALIPDIFVGNDGVENLEAKSVTDYVIRNAGHKLGSSASQVFQVLCANTNESTITDVDLAVIKMSAKKEADAMSMSSNSIIGQTVEVANKNLIVDDIAYEDPQIKTLAEKFDSEFGTAKFKFGKNVNIGKNYISRAISDFGIKYHQISLASTNENGVVYAVSVNGGTSGFKIPVKMSSENIEIPTVFIANGSVREFNEENVHEIISENLGDMKAAASASPFYDLKSSELVEIVRVAVKENNFSKAEDAINVLSQKENDKAYQTAVAIFAKNLNPSNKVAEPSSKCSNPIKTANSQHMICSHTNLPVHKVFQDKQGKCRPLSSRASEEGYDGASFMNSKIFF